MLPDMPEFSENKLALLEKYLRGELPKIVAAAGTITRCAETEVAGKHEGVVAIQTAGSKQPFFFLHGDWINGAYWCFPLASKLGSDQPFYALEPYRFEDLGTLPTLEGMAATHLKSLRAVQPEGPYLLGGFCNGGLLAYEMARQLHAQGQTVDLLVLIDPMGLVYPARDRLAHSIVSRLGDLMRLGQEKQLAYFMWLWHLYRYLQHEYRYLRFSHYRELKTELEPEQINLYGGIILALKELHEAGFGQEVEPVRADEQGKLPGKANKAGFAFLRLDALFPEPIFSNTQTIRQDYPVIYDWIAMRYVPRSLYPGKVTFFWDTSELFRSVGWRKVAEANEVEVHVITGTQSSLKGKHLHDLAECLRMCLDKTQTAKLG